MRALRSCFKCAWVLAVSKMRIPSKLSYLSSLSPPRSFAGAGFFRSTVVSQKTNLLSSARSYWTGAPEELPAYRFGFAWACVSELRMSWSCCSLCNLFYRRIFVVGWGWSRPLWNYPPIPTSSGTLTGSFKLKSCWNLLRLSFDSWFSMFAGEIGLWLISVAKLYCWLDGDTAPWLTCTIGWGLLINFIGWRAYSSESLSAFAGLKFGVLDSAFTASAPGKFKYSFKTGGLLGLSCSLAPLGPQGYDWWAYNFKVLTCYKSAPILPSP